MKSEWSAYSLLASLSWRKAPYFYPELKYLKSIFGASEPPLDQLAHLLPAGLFRDYAKLLPRFWWREAREDLHRWSGEGLLFTQPFDSQYPQKWLEKLQSPPLFVSYQGGPCWLKGPCLSVVGSRRPQVESLRWMETHLSSVLQVRPDLVLVSGGARGVDHRVHILSLRQQRLGICLLPSGLHSPYPPEIKGWRQAFLDTGGVFVSCFPPQEPVRKSHFHQRNRLIAALAEVVLVVEAGRKSGSMLTAMAALKQGAQLITLPAAPWGAGGQGNLDLMFDGADWVRDAEDLKILIEKYLKPGAA